MDPIVQMTYEDILSLVNSFYHKAINDVFIGYHFRHIEDFSTHIPRIADFWELQLLGKFSRPQSQAFNLIPLHQKLNFKRAHVRRWVILFQETLDEHSKISPEKQADLNLWREKIIFFEKKFLNHPLLYSN